MQVHKALSLAQGCDMTGWHSKGRGSEAACETLFRDWEGQVGAEAGCMGLRIQQGGGRVGRGGWGSYSLLTQTQVLVCM